MMSAEVEWAARQAAGATPTILLPATPRRNLPSLVAEGSLLRDIERGDNAAESGRREDVFRQDL